MDERRSEFVTLLAESSAVTVRLVQFLLFFLLVVLVWRNFGGLERYFQRALQHSSMFSVAGLFSINMESIQTNPSGSAIERWATFDRVDTPLVIRLAAFDDQKERPLEYFEVVAQDWLNLSGCYVGDEDQLLLLATDDLKLEPGDCLRIYTFRASSETEQGCPRSVYASRLDGKKPKGIFKYKAGRGDRIVILDSLGKPVLDMDYWWMALPKRTVGSVSRSSRDQADDSSRQRSAR